MTKGTYMRMMNRKAAAAGLLLAAGFGLSGLLPVMAQGDETAAEDVVEEAEADDVAECIDEVDCVPLDEVPPGADEGAAPAPPVEGAVVVVPGSTDESQPGGSTRPGTTPDD